MTKHRHDTSSQRTEDRPRRGTGIHRRAFLKGGGVALVSLGVALGGGPLFLHRAARAATTGSRRKVLVTVFQRGAMDGLSAVTPTADRHLAKLRPNLFLGASRRAEESDRLLDLDNGFGLHPAFEPLQRLFTRGELGIVHGVGSPDPTRSHFDAQDFMESGTPGDKGTASGWLNRVVGELGHEGYAQVSPFRAIAMTPSMPKSLYGDAKALAVQRLQDFRLPSNSGARSSSGARGGVAAGGFESLYRQASAQRAGASAADLLRDTGGETFEAVKRLESLDLSAYRPSAGARYPRSPLGQSLRQIAYLIKADLGLEVAFAESGGWDTHVRQGQGNGSFANRARDLSTSIAAFWQDLGALRSDVVLLTMTEFGRTVAENGSLGTDHGHGSCLFVLGERVAGGQVHGTVPELDRDNLYEGRDLPVTTDFRSVFASVAVRHLGVPPSAALFPGFEGPLFPLFES